MKYISMKEKFLVKIAILICIIKCDGVKHNTQKFNIEDSSHIDEIRISSDKNLLSKEKCMEEKFDTKAQSMYFKNPDLTDSHASLNNHPINNLNSTFGLQEFDKNGDVDAKISISNDSQSPCSLFTSSNDEISDSTFNTDQLKIESVLSSDDSFSVSKSSDGDNDSFSTNSNDSSSSEDEATYVLQPDCDYISEMGIKKSSNYKNISLSTIYEVSDESFCENEYNISSSNSL
ncbi:hypothetical protein TCON_1542 [Astathelohania contejeani]|uniref:Uncharacterized protein n=1 Tax=Astathelohania contejeani TaxID=164912 RepID=A0ABQ7HYG1_9MICR|nr:hypothetical protein TCON_1542 [Thelohania contejeani]